MNPTLRILALPLALAGVLTVSACGGTNSGGHDTMNHSTRAPASTPSSAAAEGASSVTAAGSPAGAAEGEASRSILPMNALQR